MESKYDGRKYEPPYVTDAERELEDFREAQKMLMDTYEEVFDERDQLRTRNAELEADIRTTHDYIESLEAEVARLRNELGVCMIKNGGQL